MRAALALLAAIETAIPPNRGHHSLMVLDGFLVLQLSLACGFQPVYLNEEDLSKVPEELVVEILQMLKNSNLI